MSCSLLDGLYILAYCLTGDRGLGFNVAESLRLAGYGCAIHHLKWYKLDKILEKTNGIMDASDSIVLRFLLIFEELLIPVILVLVLFHHSSWSSSQ
jgi:hypothetical protein